MRGVPRTNSGEEADLSETEAASAKIPSIRSSFSDSGLGGNNSDSEDIVKGETFMMMMMMMMMMIMIMMRTS